MEKYNLFSKRNLLITGLAAIVLLIPGCQTFQSSSNIQESSGQKEVYIDNNAQEHAARVESLEGRNNPVYLKLINVDF